MKDVIHDRLSGSDKESGETTKMPIVRDVDIILERIAEVISQMADADKLNHHEAGTLYGRFMGLHVALLYREEPLLADDQPRNPRKYNGAMAGAYEVLSRAGREHPTGDSGAFARAALAEFIATLAWADGLELDGTPDM